jgi:microcystin-dependent protein
MAKTVVSRWRVTLWLLACAFFLALVFLVAYIIVVYANQATQANAIIRNKQMEISDVATLNARITGVASNLTSYETYMNFTVNTEIANRITNDTIIFGDIAVIQMQLANLNVSGTSYQQQINNLSYSLAAETSARMMEDAILATLINERIKTIDGIGPDVNGNFGILGGSGIAISNGTNSITVSNTGVLSVGGAVPNAGSVGVLGNCSLGISVSPNANTLTLDTCTLETAVHGLDMTVSGQAIQISALQVNATNQQVQINSIIMAEMYFQQILNGTTTNINMSLTQLMADVLLLQMQVAALQAQLANLSTLAVPIGGILPYGGAIAPTGFVLCDGGLVNQIAYPSLWTVLGCVFCNNPGSDCINGTFCVPDLRGKVPVGQLSPDPSGYFGVRGASVGEAKHTLTVPELPVHAHTIFDSGTHRHNLLLMNGQFASTAGSSPLNCFGGTSRFDDGSPVVGYSSQSFDNINGGDLSCVPQTPYNYLFYEAGPSFNDGPTTVPERGATSAGNHNHGGQTEYVGSGQAHGNVQPSLVVTYIIRAS